MVYGDPVYKRGIDVLRALEWTPGAVLGAGVEGTVVDLSTDRVAKIWHGRSKEDLLELVRFGSALDSAPIPFATSAALQLVDEAGVLITIDRKVDGDPLRRADLEDAPIATANDARLMGDALEGLSRATDSRLASLPVLSGEPPFPRDRTFVTSLAALIQRRFAMTRRALRLEVDDVDTLVHDLLAALRQLPDGAEDALIHGDLIPANVLVTGNEVSGVLDFGFLTCLGDPQFDAAIAASIFDMFGMNHRATEELLSTAFIERFGHDGRKYALYRAAYAVITHAVHGADASDGHFAWCVAMLNRADVRDAVAAAVD